MSDFVIVLFSYVVCSGKLQREQFSTVSTCTKTVFSNRELGWRSHMGWACFLKQGEISPSPYSTSWHQEELIWEWKRILCHFANGEVGLQIRWPSTQERLSRFWVLTSSDPRLLWIPENRKRERGSLMTLWCVTVLVQWLVFALKGKITSVIFTMVHFFAMTGPRGLNQRIFSHCSRMAISPWKSDATYCRWVCCDFRENVMRWLSFCIIYLSCPD